MNTVPWHVSILIPACDEEELLPRCLNSILVARSALSTTIGFDIVVAVDSSTDRTFEIAQDILGLNGIAVCTYARMVGRARAVAAEVALTRYKGRLDRCWLANTDADSFVGKDWLVEQLHMAQHGVEAIAGTVHVDSFSEHDLYVPERFRLTYQINQDGSHPHVHGANLGVRADVYLQAGKWQNLCTAEDHDLWNRIGMLGARRNSISHIPVATSGRRNGRAPLGFAGALAAHNQDAL